MLEIKDVLAVVKKNRLLFLLGAVGLLLLLIGGPLWAENKEESPNSTIALAESYRTDLEEKLTHACMQIRGVGKAEVVLTLSSTEIAVYEKNQSGESETVASAGGEGLLLAYRMPEITGVAIVCEGGDNAAVKEELYSFFRAVLGLRYHEIHISPLK